MALKALKVAVLALLAAAGSANAQLLGQKPALPLPTLSLPKPTLSLPTLDLLPKPTLDLLPKPTLGLPQVSLKKPELPTQLVLPSMPKPLSKTQMENLLQFIKAPLTLPKDSKWSADQLKAYLLVQALRGNGYLDAIAWAKGQWVPEQSPKPSPKPAAKPSPKPAAKPTTKPAPKPSPKPSPKLG